MNGWESDLNSYSPTYGDGCGVGLCVSVGAGVGVRVDVWGVCV